MKFSHASIPVKLLALGLHTLQRQFAHALGGEPDYYEWNFTAKGEVLYETDDGEKVLAPHDMAEILAYRERDKE